MANITRFKQDARKKLLDGVTLVHDATAPTIGASGRNAAFNRWTGKPIITNDGISIANEVIPEDLGELQGADLAKQVMEEVNEEAGDATTTSIVLYKAFVEEGFYQLNDSNKNINSTKLKRQMTVAAEKVLQKIDENTQIVSSLEDLEKIAITSVEDEEKGKIIAKAIYDAGDTGIVYVNESNDIGVSVEKSEGYQFNQGLVTPYLITNFDNLETVLENPAVIITDVQVNLNEDFLKIISHITQTTREILLICDEIHPDVVKFAVKNLSLGKLKMAIVKKPMQQEYFEDVAALVGAFGMSSSKGTLKFLPEYLGGAKKIVINEKNTTIFEGNGIEQTSKVIENIKKQIEETKDESVQIKLQERLARFTGGIYIINIGENTPAEQRYLKDKVDDAVNTTKKAKAGYVVGGGVLLYNIANDLIGKSDNELNEGEQVIYHGCKQPIRKIIENAGEDVEETLAKIDNFANDFAGYDALSLEVVSNMIEAGITDSVKSTKSAFTISSKSAGLLLTTETLITPIPQAPLDGLQR